MQKRPRPIGSRPVKTSVLNGIGDVVGATLSEALIRHLSDPPSQRLRTKGRHNRRHALKPCHCRCFILNPQRLVQSVTKHPLSLLWTDPLLSGMSWLLRNRGMISFCQAGSSQMKPNPLAAYYTS
ncbi:hypothetical protein GGP41_003370 [Bipolaris sorokiniana]|uniref:Uncharacterized protein n=1 Tax=Cochliobolus sativus TaxID=45130 RepID=A0A8H5ZDC7_COCSA|nr:hypothetical protein GGP41_003370 [Bipolaris sorokiniana]